MAGRHVVVTLTPVYHPDTLPFRTLTFTDPDDSITVGRSSKSESKQLIPAHNNAWFDNRVISRNHAEIYASFAEKKVLITDSGSMHGTFIDDKQVAIDEESEIKTGDVLTFGSEVTRWPKDDRPRNPTNPFALDTFPPLKVRCECQWFEDSVDKEPAEEESAHQTSKNSFSVPEEDDDDDVRVIEPVLQSQPAKPRVFSPIHFTVPCSEDSEDDSGSDEEEGSKSSPPTSHSDEIKESAVASEVKESIVKPSVEDMGKEHQTLSMVSHIQPYIPLPTRLGSQDRPIEVENRPVDVEGSLFAMSDIDGWKDEEPKDYSPSASGDESDSGSDEEAGRSPLNEVACEVRESAPAFLEPPVGPENKASKEHNVEDHAAIPSTAESVVGSPYAEIDSDDESKSEVDSMLGSDSSNGLAMSPCFAPANPILDGDGNPRRFTPLISLLRNSRDNGPPQTENLEKPTLPGFDLDGWGVPSDPARRVASPSDKALAKPPELGAFGSNNTFKFPTFPGSQDQPRPVPWPHVHASSVDYPMDSYLETTRRQMPQPPAPSPAAALRNDLTRSMSTARQDPKYPAHTDMSEIMKEHDEIYAEHMRRFTERRGANHRRVAISDIVANADSESNLGSGLGKGVKRKADEMEEEKPEAATQGQGVDVAQTMNDAMQGSIGVSDSIPDAQPQNVVGENGYSASQLTELSEAKADEAESQAQAQAQDENEDQDQDQEPPRKKVKMTTEATNASRPRGNFTKYAATALAGAVVGGVGAIATLIALPPDFFA